MMIPRQGVRMAASALVLFVSLPGCAVDKLAGQQRDQARGMMQQLNTSHDRFAQQTKRADHPTRVPHVGKPWVSGRAIALAPEVALPPALRAGIQTTLIFKQKKASLSEVASRISLATGISVRVAPDARLPTHLFLPRLGAADASSVAVVEKEPPQMPMGTRPLVQVLDLIAAAHDVRWRFTGKAIEFFRTETRVFDLRTVTLPASAEMRMGKSGNQSAGGFDSSAQTSLSMPSQQVLDDIRQRIEPFLTRAGVVAAQAGSQTSIVVTDTPEVLDAISRYLDQVNRSMTRRVRLVFEELMVTRKETHEQGVDWSLALAAELSNLQLSTPSAGASALPMASFGLTAPSIGGVSGSLLLKTVSRYADVVRHTTVPVVTLNRRPVTHAVRSTFTYIDQVQSLATGKKDEATPSLPGIAVSQKRETVGAFLTLVPDIQEEGLVLLSIAYDNTVALPLKTLSFGGPSNTLQIQQLNLQGNGTVQQVALEAGRPTLIAGFEQKQNDTLQDRLTPDAPRLLGGHEHVGNNRSITLIFVTAQVQEGG